MAKRVNIDDAYEMSHKIISFYKARGVPLEICKWDIAIRGKQYKFRVGIKKGTKLDLIRKYATDAKYYLELQLFQVEEEGTSVFIIASRKLSGKNGLIRILKSDEYAEAKKTMGVVHLVGIDNMGNPVICDLTKYPHAAIVGTTRSGKSIAVKSLVVGLACTYSPQQVSLLIADGASDLQQFDVLPHLSHPVINSSETFFNVMLVLRDEMERRIRLKSTAEFNRFSFVVCIVDEFSSFISGFAQDKQKLDLLTETIVELLRRGRHARIHLVLATHNLTKRNVRIDTGDIPVKLVFRVANLQNSLTALGAGGADKLRGEGDMFFSQNGEKRHLLGTYVSEEQIRDMVNSISQYYKKNASLEYLLLHEKRYSFVVTEAALRKKMDEMVKVEMDFSVSDYSQKDANNRNLLLAKVLFWTLSQSTVSGNRLCKIFNIGWTRANEFLNKLQYMGIIDDLDAKLPRAVLSQTIDDVPKEVLALLTSNGFSIEDVSDVISNRAEK